MENKFVEQTGLIFELKPTDYVLGASPLSGVDILQDGDWEKYLPPEEKQARMFVFDTLSCATFSALNIVETWINYFIEKDMFSVAQLETMNKLGFFIDGKFNASDQFTAIMSGTTKNGNTMQNVWDSIRRDGLLPQNDLPAVDSFSIWEEYHNPKLITLEMRAKALKMKDIIDWAYEFVTLSSDADKSLIGAALKQSPVQLGIPAVAHHAVEGYKDGSYFDTYDPFKKQYTGVQFSMKIIATIKKQNKYRFLNTLKLGSRGEEVKKFQEIIGVKIDGSFGPKTKAAAMEWQKKNGLVADGIIGYNSRKVLNVGSDSLIPKWAKAIQNHEGYYAGSRSYRNNNPGNFKSGSLTDFMRKLGATSVDSDGFCIFPSYYIGFQALCSFLTMACKDQLGSYQSKMTLLDFYKIYAPSTDNNNPTTYAQAVAMELGGTISNKIDELL